jgi:hypothetical protein
VRLGAALLPGDHVPSIFTSPMAGKETAGSGEPGLAMKSGAGFAALNMGTRTPMPNNTNLDFLKMSAINMWRGHDKHSHSST